MSVRIILVRPRNPGNIGAVARAMGNFGFNDLYVVDPYPPVWDETRSAPDAEEIVRRAHKVDGLSEAVRGCSRVLGTSSFAHRTLEQAIVPLPTIHDYRRQIKSKDKVAIIFGSERSGLSNAELAACEAIICIPMFRPKVSMNLAQAVAVVLYEWTRAQPERREKPLKASETPGSAIDTLIQLSERVGYAPGYTLAARSGRIRQAMHGTTLTPEAARFWVSFSRWLLKKHPQT